MANAMRKVFEEYCRIVFLRLLWDDKEVEILPKYGGRGQSNNSYQVPD